MDKTRHRKTLSGIAEAILISALFLSRLPLGWMGKWLEIGKRPDFERIAFAFPLSGMLIALPIVVLAWVTLLAAFPATISALLIIGSMVVVTGALHEDGLADVADGFWGGHDRLRKLEIMRDSAIGTYGTLALIFVTALRVVALAAIIRQFTVTDTLLILIVIASLSRAMIVPVWVSLPAARPDSDTDGENGTKPAAGLSTRYGAPGREIVLRTFLASLPALLIAILVVSPFATIMGLLVAGLACWLVMDQAKRHIGGHTGDVLGCTQQMSEMGLYLGFLIAI